MWLARLSRRAGVGFALLLAVSAIGSESTPTQNPAPPKPVDPSLASKLSEHPKSSETSAKEEDDPTLVENDPLGGQEIIIGRKDETRKPAEPPPPPPAKSVKAEAVCPTCKNRGFKTTTKADQAYMLFESDPAPDPELYFGWTPCPDCKLGLEMKQRFENQKDRLAKRTEVYAAHEKAMGLAFIDFETRNATGHFQTTPVEARDCAKYFEKLSRLLREHCEGDAYLKANPAAQHMVVCENGERYALYLERFSKSHPENEGNWKDLARTTSSFGSRNLTVIRRDAVAATSAGLGHITVFVYAQMLVHEACDSKAPIWFCEGFSSLCESLIFENPWCYSIRYEQNKLSFDVNWTQAVAKGVKDDKIQEWEVLFTREMISMPVLEYQECWSIVRYLYKADAVGFAKLPELFKQGLETKKALEQAFGKPLAQLEKEWRLSAAQGR
ncbi:MAG: hypothetical protein HY291_22040 [Planctomycetes bacterium]|nr:hypothetical protein [Planctomycetota bacterium]